MIKDLTGQKFGKLTVIRKADEDKVYGGIKRTTWLCRCECGNEVEVITSNLTNETSTSCGCGKTQLKDLTGRRYGKLTVLERAENSKIYGGKRVPTWKCRCDCGNIIYVAGNNLKRGLTLSCGCCNYTDLTGERFGKLTVLKQAGRKVYGDKEYIAWQCQCDCGNIVEVIGQSLRDGNTTSCGCNKSQLKDLTGRRYGKLTVLERAENDKIYGDRKVLTWKCRCDCGNIIDVVGNSLKKGYTTSCGCGKRKNNNK